MTEKTDIRDSDEKVVEIEMERLRNFTNHPFKIIGDSQMIELQDSIKKYGVLNPLIVRPRKEGYYEIISGHRRKYAAERLGYKKIPVIIRMMQDDEAVVTMVDSNLQREQITPSEKAYAYKMKYDAIKKKAGRKNCGQVDHNTGKRSIDVIGELCGDSAKQVQRYIKMTELIPALLDKVDDGSMGFTPAVQLSYLKKKEQQEIIDAMEATQCTPSLSQAIRIKKLSEAGKLTESEAEGILGEIKQKEADRVVFKNEQLYRFFPSTYEIMPIGTLGEIVVGGLGVSDGYLHRKELNAEKFITLPELTKSVLYKTGDLGRLLPTGEFEFFGRIDNQVKIRGYRVELDEVKQAIKKYEGITDVIITTYNRNSNISLCAYYVSDREIVAKLLREYLSTQLPDYMIPTYFTSIDKIPVTLNGKVDFKALPEPSIDLSDREIVLPRNDTEKRLAAVWQDVLGISENLSIDDNFFDLGGDSILAIQISSTAKSEGLNIEVKDIMQNPTIRELGVIAKVDTRQNVISQEPIMGEVQLSPIQKRFFERLRALNHWNQSIVLHSRKPVDTHLLKNAFEILLDRHDMLRAVYTEADHRFEQSVVNPQDKESMYRFMVINVETEITSTIIEEKGKDNATKNVPVKSGKSR